MDHIIYKKAMQVHVNPNPTPPTQGKVRYSDVALITRVPRGYKVCLEICVSDIFVVLVLGNKCLCNYLNRNYNTCDMTSQNNVESQDDHVLI